MANVTFNCGGRLNRPFGIEVSSKKNTNLVRLAKYSSYEKVHPALGNLAINFLYAFHPIYMVFLKEVARDIKGNNDIKHKSHLQGRAKKKEKKIKAGDLAGAIKKLIN